jgi:hypothetical protein
LKAARPLALSNALSQLVLNSHVSMHAKTIAVAMYALSNGQKVLALKTAAKAVLKVARKAVPKAASSPAETAVVRHAAARKNLPVARNP